MLKGAIKRVKIACTKYPLNSSTLSQKNLFSFKKNFNKIYLLFTLQFNALIILNRNMTRISLNKCLCIQLSINKNNIMVI